MLRRVGLLLRMVTMPAVLFNRQRSTCHPRQSMGVFRLLRAVLWTRVSVVELTWRFLNAPCRYASSRKTAHSRHQSAVFSA